MGIERKGENEKKKKGGDDYEDEEEKNRRKNTRSCSNLTIVNFPNLLGAHLLA
jgi:hypothetical protein